MLHGPAISQSGCRKAGPYQLLYNKNIINACFDLCSNFSSNSQMAIYLDPFNHMNEPNGKSILGADLFPQ